MIPRRAGFDIDLIFLNLCSWNVIVACMVVITLKLPNALFLGLSINIFYSFCVPPDSRFSLEETSRLDGVVHTCRKYLIRQPTRIFF